MASQSSISTLSEFLLQAQTQYKVFDLGRGIRNIDNQTFFEWENQQSPCAYPRQDHAWFCIVFWNERLNDEQYIWFIKLPLDENGLLISAALNQFLEIIVQALGQNLEHTQNSKAQLPENPFVFVPSQQQLADCNAHIRKVLNVKRSTNPKANAYLQAPSLVEDEQAWASLSLQDIADFVIHPNSDNTSSEHIQRLIAQNLSAYAKPVLNCLFASLESVEVNETLASALIKFHQSSPEPNLAALCIRAMSYKPHALCIDYLSQLIQAGARNNDTNQDLGANSNKTTGTDLETCVVIVGRYWSLLNNSENLASFMHNVALLDNSYNLFKGLYADLVKIPETRKTMLSFIRQADRSQEVSKAIGALFAAT
jgi:hypothetical protein